MEEYLNKDIKETISKIPEVAAILNEYSIGCVPCSVGSCVLKDVVAIHNLPKEQEIEMMYRIEKAIYPNRDIKIPVFERTNTQVTPKEIKYSPPLKKLVDEHTLIKRWIKLIPKVTEAINTNTEIDKQLILDGVDFIRSYADRLHHAKEEKILFRYFDENLDIIKAMLEDHEIARNYVKAVIEALEKENKGEISEHLNGYKDLLIEHIKKEDEILYPWIDRNISTTQVGELFAKFNEADKEVGEMVPEKYERLIVMVEERLQKNQKEEVTK